VTAGNVVSKLAVDEVYVTSEGPSKFARLLVVQTILLGGIERVLAQIVLLALSTCQISKI